MKHKREHKYGTLTFDLGYAISEAEDRPVQYSRTGAMYRPNYLRFTLTSTSLEEGRNPRYKDLGIGTIALSGRRLRKDGTPGGQETTERIYNYEHEKLPEWVMPLIQYAVKDVQEMGPA
jgi:hypothetical protein